jgi:hypothetical protein
MRRSRPAYVEQLSQCRVAGFGLQQARLVPRMSVGLVAGHKSGAHDDSHGAGTEHCTRRRRIADPARCKHRQRHCPSHLGQQRQQPHNALYMTAGLDALDDQRVSARIGRRSRRVPRADLYQHSRACSPRARDQLRTKPERERHDRRTLLNSHLESLVLLKIEHEIDAKRAIRYPPDRADLVAQDPQLGPRRAQRAEASRPRHLASESRRGGAGDRRLHDRNLDAESAHDASLQRVDETCRRAQSSLPFAIKQPRRSGPDHPSGAKRSRQ